MAYSLVLLILDLKALTTKTVRLKNTEDVKLHKGLTSCNMCSVSLMKLCFHITGKFDNSKL